MTEKKDGMQNDKKEVVLTEWQQRNIEFLKKKKEEEAEKEKVEQEFRKEKMSQMQKEGTKEDDLSEAREDFSEEDASVKEEFETDDFEEVKDGNLEKEVPEENESSLKKEKNQNNKTNKVKQAKEKPPFQIARLKAMPVLIISGFILLISFFLVTPFSKEKSVSVSGVTHSVESEILTASGIDDSDYFFSLLFNHRLFEENVIKNDSWIKSASLTYQFPNKFILKVNEYNIIAYTQTDGGYQPILENGTRKEVVDASQLPETFLTINLTDEKAIQKLIKAFSKLDENLVSQIQTVSSAESTTTSDLLLLNMHDGNTIRVPLSEIAEKLPYYTQIKGNIAEGSIVDMEVGIYATTEAIESEAAAEKESTEESIASDATDDATTETDNSTVEVSPTNEIYNPVEGVAEDFTISQ